jgi:hypothetical protein
MFQLIPATVPLARTDPLPGALLAVPPEVDGFVVGAHVEFELA